MLTFWVTCLYYIFHHFFENLLKVVLSYCVSYKHISQCIFFCYVVVRSTKSSKKKLFIFSVNKAYKFYLKLKILSIELINAILF